MYELSLAVGNSREHIAARIRVLLASSRLSVADSAARLGVVPSELRTSVDELAPFPTLDVLTAIVHYYGVDPQYLLTGEYSQETHSIALEGGRDAGRAVLTRLIAQLSEPSVGVAARWRPTAL